MIIREKDKKVLAFFGITEENIHIKRFNLFTKLDEIVTYGEGYDWNTVYNMPLWLRDFTYKKIEERFKKKNEQIDEQNGMINSQNAAEKMMNAPKVANTYTTHVKSPTK